MKQLKTIQSIMIRLGFLIKFSKKILSKNFLFSHEINQFCSKHSLQDVYINQFDRLDESLIIVNKKNNSFFLI